tara:strand:+ start:323 stop:2290 length:1968 start_codon:yes stop_codon:yes gene_type:complete
MFNFVKISSANVAIVKISRFFVRNFMQLKYTVARCFFHSYRNDYKKKYRNYVLGLERALIQPECIKKGKIIGIKDNDVDVFTDSMSKSYYTISKDKFLLDCENDKVEVGQECDLFFRYVKNGHDELLMASYANADMPEVYLHASSTSVLHSVLSMARPMMISPLLAIGQPGYELSRGEISQGGFSDLSKLCHTCFTKVDSQNKIIIRKTCRTYSGEAYTFKNGRGSYQYQFYHDLNYYFKHMNVVLIFINRSLSQDVLFSAKQLKHIQESIRFIANAYECFAEMAHYIRDLDFVMYFFDDLPDSGLFSLNFWSILHANIISSQYSNDFLDSVNKITQGDRKIFLELLVKSYEVSFRKQFYNTTCSTLCLSRFRNRELAVDTSFYFQEGWSDTEMLDTLDRFIVLIGDNTANISNDIRSDYKKRLQSSKKYYQVLNYCFAFTPVEIESGYDAFGGFTIDKSSFLYSTIEERKRLLVDVISIDVQKEERKFRKIYYICSKRLETMTSLVHENSVLKEKKDVNKAVWWRKSFRKTYYLLVIKKVHALCNKVIKLLPNRVQGLADSLMGTVSHLDYPCYFLYFRRSFNPRFYLVCESTQEYRAKVPLKLADFGIIIVPKEAKSCTRLRLKKRGVDNVFVASTDDLGNETRSFFKDNIGL